MGGGRGRGGGCCRERLRVVEGKGRRERGIVMLAMLMALVVMVVVVQMVVEASGWKSLGRESFERFWC